MDETPFVTLNVPIPPDLVNALANVVGLLDNMTVAAAIEDPVSFLHAVYDQIVTLQIKYHLSTASDYQPTNNQSTESF
jgi:hypothetical protein